MDELGISIVMPLYNAEKYLEETLTSIKNQTYKNFELICVNDASTDRTLSILSEFQKRDSRIVIMENEQRQGAAVSRNKGIGVAQGKYLTFLDGDDVFDEEMLQLAYETAENYAADIVVYEYMHVPSEHIYEKRYVWHDESFVERYCKKPFIVTDIDPRRFFLLANSPCNKMYRREFVFSNKLQFQPLACCNDVYFVRMALYLSSKIIILDTNRVMVYARDHFEPSRISFKRDPMCTYKAFEKLGEELEKRKMFSSIYEYYYYQVAAELIATINKCKDREEAKDFYEFLQKQGISKLVAYGGQSYENVTLCIREFFENFRTLSFESEWYKQKSISAFGFEKEKIAIFDLIQMHLDAGKSVFLWGAGKIGKNFIDFLDKYNVSISGVVDCDEKKRGISIGKYIIGLPQDLIKEGDVILFTNGSVYDDVKQSWQEEKYCLINVREIIDNY